jgi:hypothetical protein
MRIETHRPALHIVGDEDQVVEEQLPRSELTVKHPDNVKSPPTDLDTNGKPEIGKRTRLKGSHNLTQIDQPNRYPTPHHPPPSQQGSIKHAKQLSYPRWYQTSPAGADRFRKERSR